MIVPMDEPAWVDQLPRAAVQDFPALNDDVLDLHDVRIVDASASWSDVLDTPELVTVALQGCDVAGVVANNGRMHRVLVTGSRLRGVTWGAGIVQDVLVEATTGGDVSFRFSLLRRVTFRDCVLPDLDFTEATFDHVRFERCLLT